MDGRTLRWSAHVGRRKRGRCLHCCQPRLQLPARGLCWGCYEMRGVRQSYPLGMEGRRPWTTREFANAVAMVRQGLTYREVARELRRSIDSVKRKLRGVCTEPAA